MTHEQALGLEAGDRIASPIDNPRYRIRRITRVWVSDDRRRVLVSCHGYKGGDWFPPHGWVRVPARAVGYDEHLHQFVRTMGPLEREKLNAEYGERTATGKRLPPPADTIAEGQAYLDALESAASQDASA